MNKRGRGPGEYIFMGPLFIDDNEEFVEFIDFSLNKVLKYSNISFEFIEAEPFPNLNFNSSRRKDGFYYIATQQIDNMINEQNTNAGLLVVDDKGNVKTLFDKNIETRNSYYSINGESFTENDNGMLFFSLMFDNTFYSLEAGEAYPVFTVDFGKYGINNAAIGLLSTEKQMNYIRDINNRAFFPVLDINNSNVMSFSYLFKQDKTERRGLIGRDDYRLYLNFKANDKVFHVKQIKNDLSNFPDRIFISSSYFSCAHEAWYEDYLVDIVIPDLYFESPTDKIFVENIGEVSALDNPIIVLIKLKKIYQNNNNE